VIFLNFTQDRDTQINKSTSYFGSSGFEPGPWGHSSTLTFFVVIFIPCRKFSGLNQKISHGRRGIRSSSLTVTLPRVVRCSSAAEISVHMFGHHMLLQHTTMSIRSEVKQQTAHHLHPFFFTYNILFCNEVRPLSETEIWSSSCYRMMNVFNLCRRFVSMTTFGEKTNLEHVSRNNGNNKSILY
jgi:hypothetical protein